MFSNCFLFIIQYIRLNGKLSNLNETSVELSEVRNIFDPDPTED